jgi:hypothetical protein
MQSAQLWLYKANKCLAMYLRAIWNLLCQYCQKFYYVVLRSHQVHQSHCPISRVVGGFTAFAPLNPLLTETPEGVGKHRLPAE